MAAVEKTEQAGSMAAAAVVGEEDEQ